MSNVVNLSSPYLSEFIARQRKIFDSVDLGVWDYDDWSLYNGGRSLTFYKDRERRGRLSYSVPALDNEFSYKDFVKAFCVYMRGRGKVADHAMKCLRRLEIALINKRGKADPSLIDDQVIQEVISLIAEGSEGTCYARGAHLKKIVDVLISNKITNNLLPIENPFPRRRDYRIKSQEIASTKLPNLEVINFVGEVFHSNPPEHKDIVTSSMFAIMLSTPCRVSELLELRHDCLQKTFDTSSSQNQMTLRWFGAKGYGVTSKIIPHEMHEIVEQAISRINLISESARNLALNLEENPSVLPLNQITNDSALYSVDQDEIVGFDRFDKIFGITITGRENYKRFISNALKSINHREKTWPRCSKREEAKTLLEQQLKILHLPPKKLPPHTVRKFKSQKWKFILTFRDLNKIIRSAYLPQFFPFISSNKETKYSEALFCFFSSQLNSKNRTETYRLMEFVPNWFNKALVGDGETSFKSSTLNTYFPDVYTWEKRITSHSLRHLLNTIALKSDVSGHELAAWSSRKDLRQNAAYNQITDEEMVEKTRELLLNGNSNKSDAIKVIENPNVEEAPHLATQETPFGRCRSPWAVSPCELNGDCIGCDSLACIKGEKEKETNIREEVERYKLRLGRAVKAEKEGAVGAEKWVEYYLAKISRGEELIAIFDNKQVPDGSLIVPDQTKLGLKSTTHKALQNSGNVEKSTKPSETLSLNKILALTGDKI